MSSSIDPEGSGRVCVFCGDRIGDSDPPEHVFPKWLKKFRPKGAVFLHIPRPTIRGDAVSGPSMPEFRSKNLELTADTVCAKCNHGWMSDLENGVATTLTPMIEGAAQVLGVECQAVVSTWVAKTALTFDQSMPADQRSLPLEYCRWVCAHKLPPPGAQIRLAHYDGTDQHFVRAVYHGLYDELPTDRAMLGPPEAHRTTIRIGKLIAEFTVTKDTKPVLSVRGGDLADMLITVWPSVEGVSWPPRLRFNDASLGSFTNPRNPSVA